MIREKSTRDRAGSAALAQVTHLVDGYPRYQPPDMAAFVTPAGEVAGWVVELDGEIVGHVALHTATGDPTSAAARGATGRSDHQLAVVARLMVHPRVRRRGLARRLLQTATMAAARRGQRVVLDVLKESTDVLTCYEQLGWQRIGDVVLPLPGVPALDLWVYLGPDVAGADVADADRGEASNA